jgi:hypothetical protein
MDFTPLNKDELDHTWVTLLRCHKLVEADLIATRLRAAEIAVFIPDEYLMQAISFNLNTYGFIRLQVSPSQYEAARAVLADAEAVDSREPSL